MAVNAGSSLCIVHFEGKLGPEKQLTNETLQTIVNRRREWLELPEHEKYNTSRNIAEKSFEYISDGIENIQELHGVMSYHLTCYRSFTDITKLERARKIAASEPPKRCSTSTDERCDPAEKVQRTTRHSFGLNYGNEATPRSSNVLPKCCFICKEAGHVYVTNTVRKS